MELLSKIKRIDQYLFLSALFLAILLRFIQLGVSPLTDSEARLALQSLEIARGNSPVLDSYPGYILLTAFNFFLLGAGNFLARFWPALAGASLVLLPISFFKQLGRTAAIILAFALAIDPGLIAASRVAGDQMMALAFLALFISSMNIRKYQIAGVMAGLALLSGPSIWFGFLGIGITIVLLKLRKGKESQAKVEFPVHPIASLKTLLYWGTGTLILVGTLFFLVLNGLSAWAGSLVEFIKWFFPSVPSQEWHLLPTLLVYEPMLIIFGFISLVLAFLHNDRKMVNIAVLSFIFLLMTSLNPSHRSGDLVWFILPFWVLTSLGMAQILAGLSGYINKRVESLLVAGIVFTFLAFLGLNIMAIPAVLGIDNQIFQSRILLIAGALALLVLVIFLVSAVWDEKIAQAGLLIGVLFALALYTTSVGVGSTGIKTRHYKEIWQGSPQFTGADLLLDTIESITRWQVGPRQSISVTILSDMNYPSLLWILRDINIETTVSLPLDSSPQLVIYGQGSEPALPGQYRHQNFEITRKSAFSSLSWEGWFRWAIARIIPYDSAHLVLSVRSDLLPVTDDGNGQ
ncbi:hypothetical protein ACFLXB_01400 [Chloroflexota bacterium]